MTCWILFVASALLAKDLLDGGGDEGGSEVGALLLVG